MRLILLALCLAAAIAGPASAADLLIADVTIIDPATATRRPGMDVEVDHGRITRVRPHRWRGLARGRTIDGRGRYLIPGLWDMHVHLSDLTEPTFSLLIAQGVTSVRDMGGDVGALRVWRHRIERGDLVGPRIKFCGPMLEGPGTPHLNHEIVDGPDAARATVARLAGEGVDCIKVRGYKDEATYRALAESARAARLPLYGHAPFGMDPIVAAALGQKTFEHAFYPYPFHDLPADRKEAILLAFRNAGVWIDPTMVAWATATRQATDLEAEYATLTPEAAAQRFISPVLLANWAEGVGYTRSEGRGSPGWIAAIRQAGLDAGEMYRAGIPVLAGTDLGAPFVRPDTALYEELERLVAEVGLTPAEALTAATLEPATVFGLQNDLGSVDPGKLADMVLLTADPMVDIANVRSVDTVIVRGIAYGPQARAALRAEAVVWLRALWRAQQQAAR